MRIVELRVKVHQTLTVDELDALAEELKDAIYDCEPSPAIVDVTYEVRDDYQE
jgi:hypothetical protein